MIRRKMGLETCGIVVLLGMVLYCYKILPIWECVWSSNEWFWVILVCICGVGTEEDRPSSLRDGKLEN